MSLSCSCDIESEWYFEPPTDYTLLDTKRRRRCSSCKCLIDLGSTVVKFTPWRSPNDDIEERIYGDEVPIAPMYLCETCGDLYFSFIELGFECVHPAESMHDLLDDYQDLQELQKWEREK